MYLPFQFAIVLKRNDTLNYSCNSTSGNIIPFAVVPRIGCPILNLASSSTEQHMSCNYNNIFVIINTIFGS